VYKLGLKLVKTLSLVYIYLLIFPLSFVYTIRVNEVFFKVVDHSSNYFEGINGIKLVSSIQVTLSVSISSIKDIIYTSILIYEVIGVDLEFANDLDVLVVIGRINTVNKLCWIKDLNRAGLMILMDFLFG